MQAPSWVGRLVTGVIALGAFGAALGSEDRLIRVGAVLALVGFVLAWLLAGMLGRPRLRVVTASWWLILFAVTAAFFAISLSVGGGAVNGAVENGRYFVADHGRHAEVSPFTFFVVAGLELLVFLLVPGGLFLAIAASRSDGAR